jgi:hypothetical protein
LAYFWGKREINLKLRDIMEKAFYDVYRPVKRKSGYEDCCAAY